MSSEPDDPLHSAIKKKVQRMERAERERPSLLAQTVFMGTLAGLFVLPVIVGAYLGNWLDSHMSGYSVRWTVSLILLGVFIGVINVYRYLKEH